MLAHIDDFAIYGGGCN